MPLPRSVRRCVLAAAALAALAVAEPAAADCPGAAPNCPYVGGMQVGQQAGGVLRFPQAIAIAADGTTYVGDQGSRVVHVFDAAGTFVRTIGSPGSRPGTFFGVGSLAVAGDGSLLVAGGGNRIDRFAPDGRLLSSWSGGAPPIGTFRFGNGRGNDTPTGGGLVASGSTVYVADSGHDRILRFSIDGQHGAEIVPPGTVRFPKGLAVRGTRLFVADDQNHRILVMDTGGHLLTTIGGVNGPKPGQLDAPYGVALDPAGRLFVADNLNQRIVRYSGPPTYPYKGRWGSYGTAPGRLAFPRAIATDPQGRVYVTNTGNDRVDVFDRTGALVRTFGRSGRAAGQFNTPSGVAADATGYSAVVDTYNGRVQFLNPDGSIATVWGTPNPGPTILRRPVAVAFDPAGNAYVLDQRRGVVVVFDRATGLPVRTMGGLGTGPGQLLEPTAIAMAPGGVLLVADAGNRRIARFTTSGVALEAYTGLRRLGGIATSPDGSRIYTTDAGNRISVLGLDGTRIQEFGNTGTKPGRLNRPAQLTVDASGVLWVVDRGNHRIQRFAPDGTFLGTFGERGQGQGQFINPVGVSIDCRGTLTVTDTANNRVQRFALAAPSTGACAPLGPLGTPPAPRVPTLPEPDGPQVTLRALRTTSILAGRTVPLRVSCDTACTAVAEVLLTPRAAPRKGKRRVTVVIRASRQVGSGESAILRPRMTARQSRILLRALGRARGLRADIRILATAPVGEPTEVTRRVLVTR